MDPDGRTTPKIKRRLHSLTLVSYRQLPITPNKRATSSAVL